MYVRGRFRTVVPTHMVQKLILELESSGKYLWQGISKD